MKEYHKPEILLELFGNLNDVMSSSTDDYLLFNEDWLNSDNGEGES